ncbi:MULTISPECIES: hypothetical protein [Paenibacillus]|uniref:Uncharacterized protein n=1 Tax=Paenibacillus lactis 154 TaxID=743719 RepID=G4HIU0_9BACL|nr:MULTISPECIES: hypothetical protein [Paenibacillus]EHB62658.1 hypothetical protein PaelaDRAFT_3901 [Paenibacillus lactis 154]MCM3494685.1 hypothetical protein [Paenibacillus lactis]
MDKIMTVSLAFDHKEEGTILVGINPELDSLSYPEIVSMIGNRIILKHDDHEAIHEVRSIQISTSMANKKNIGISIGKNIKANDIQLGSVVYTIK